MNFALLDYVLPLNLGFRLIIIPHFVLDIDFLIVYVLPRNGQPHQKEKRQPPVLLPGRKRSRRRPTSHRSSGLSRHRRKSRRTHRAKGRPGSPSERFTSQAFWDAFEQILPESSETLTPAEDPLDQAQLRLLGLWKEQHLVGRRLLAYDTTNFYTYIASTNTRNHLAQRGHNKQGRHNLRQVGLSYVLDGESGLSLCHHVYPGNVADVDEFSVALARIVRLLDQSQMARDTVTLVFDKGTAARDNTVQLA